MEDFLKKSQLKYLFMYPSKYPFNKMTLKDHTFLHKACFEACLFYNEESVSFVWNVHQGLSVNCKDEASFSRTFLQVSVVFLGPYFLKYHHIYVKYGCGFVHMLSLLKHKNVTFLNVFHSCTDEISEMLKNKNLNRH